MKDMKDKVIGYKVKEVTIYAGGMPTSEFKLYRRQRWFGIPYNKLIGVYIISGILLQIILEFFSKAVIELSLRNLIRISTI